LARRGANGLRVDGIAVMDLMRYARLRVLDAEVDVSRLREEKERGALELLYPQPIELPPSLVNLALALAAALATSAVTPVRRRGTAFKPALAILNLEVSESVDPPVILEAGFVQTCGYCP
jgi:hypothetical protein